jgi:hypothetical protein
MRISVLESEYSDEFENLTSDSVVLLTDESAEEIWSLYIGSDVPSYMRLPDHNWVISSQQVFIGNWLRVLDTDEGKCVTNILNSEIVWDDDDIVWFCISKYRILESSWSVFKNYWRCYIYCDDDCPIVVNKRFIKCGVLFTPIGNIIKVGC